MGQRSRSPVRASAVLDHRLRLLRQGFRHHARVSFGLGACSAVVLGCGGNGSDDARTSYGYIGQITVTPANSKVTIAGSYGSSILQESDTEEAAGADFKTENTLISGGVYL